MGSIEATIAGVVTGRTDWSERQCGLALRAIGDSMAIGIAGARSRQAEIVRNVLAPCSSAEVLTAPLWDDARAFTVTDAAFVAGTAAHSLDWDDYMHPMHGHCSAVLLGAVWPVAEALDASGADMLEAFLVGYQVDWLVSLALSHAHYRRGWHSTSTIGTIGAAAAVARLLDLTAKQSATALGVAASHAGGIRANFGTTTKSTHGGLAARHGVQSALLARAGATASPDWLLGPAGVLEAFGGEHDVAVASTKVVAGIDSGEHGIETSWGLVQKPYACCGSIHGAVDALLDVLLAHDITAADIESVTAHVDPLVTSIMRHEVPPDEQAARYSPTWVMAATVTDRAAGPAQFSAEAVQRDDIHRMRERIRVVSDLEASDEDRFGGWVEVVAGGKTKSARVSHASGHPHRPMTDQQLRAKQMQALTMVMKIDDAAGIVEAVETLLDHRIRTLGNSIRTAFRPA